MINHRYRITHELGAGGSGRVFLVEDALSGNALRALKVLTRLPAPRPGVEDPFLTEVSVLLTLQHPHLVALYDVDTVRQSSDPSLDGHRFFTMEYFDGSDALTWFAGVSQGREKVAALRMLLAQCFEVLAYIHANNVIHSDIKPQNILVRGDPVRASLPEVKLTDFGISRPTNADSGMPARGTLEYSAPEVLRGEKLDHRTDLYSLGATIFHLVEGQCPFESNDAILLAKKILTEDIAFSGPLWRDMPGILDVVQSLLQRGASARPATALEALRMMGSGEFPTSVNVGVHHGRMPFVGRPDELRHVTAMVLGSGGTMSGEQPAAIVLNGVEGMGKSRFVEEIVRSARVSGMRIFPAVPAGKGVPYSSVSPMLKALAVESRSHAEAAGKSLTGNKAYLERLLGEGRIAERGVEALFMRDRESTAERLARFVIACSSVMPLVVVADDLDRMDENSVQVLQTIARDVPTGKTILLATTSSDFAWPQETRVEKIFLKDLSSADVVALTESMFGKNDAVNALGGKLYEVLGGMPLVLLEALRALHGSIDTQYLCENIETALGVVERVLPRDADALLLHRINHLSPEERLLFTYASCFDGTAPISMADQFLALHATRIRTGLRGLEAAGLVSVREDRIAVRVARLKRIVYEMLGNERFEVHRMIAKQMSDSIPNPTIPDLQEIAHQFGVVGEAGCAAEYLERVAQRLFSLQAYQLSIDLFSQATEAARMAADSNRVSSLQIQKAEVLLQSGRTKEAVELATSALAGESLSTSVRRKLLRLVNIGRSRLGDFTQAKEGFRELIQSATDAGDRAELTQELVNIEINLGGFKDAEETCVTQLEVANELKNEGLKGAILTDLGIATFLQGRYDDAAGHFRRALGIFESLNDPAHVVSAMTNVANALNARGDCEEAIEQWRRALDCASASGTLSQQAKIQNNLGIAYFNMRRYADARACYTQSRETFQRLGMKGELTYTLTNLGEVALADGDYGGALATWNEALALYEMMADVRGVTETSLQLAELYLTLGDYREPESLLEGARRHIENEAIDPFRPDWLFWSGILHTKRESYASALSRLREAENAYTRSEEQQKSLRCIVAIGQCLLRSGDPGGAADQLRRIVSMPAPHANPRLLAEAKYLLGLSARETPGSPAGLPLLQFKEGMHLIEHEPISEVTWKLSYALAREYFERGQRERARSHLLLTEKVLRHFLSTLPTEDLRQIYLAAEGRGQALANIERHSQQQLHGHKRSA